MDWKYLYSYENYFNYNGKVDVHIFSKYRFFVFFILCLFTLTFAFIIFVLSNACKFIESLPSLFIFTLLFGVLLLIEMFVAVIPTFSLIARRLNDKGTNGRNFYLFGVFYPLISLPFALLFCLSFGQYTLLFFLVYFFFLLYAYIRLYQKPR